MQPDDIGRLVSVSDPRVAPDGRQVAFVVTRVDLAANRYRSAVWLAAADGSVPPYPLTDGEDDATCPRWSPDGRRLALSRRGTGPDASSTLQVLPVGVPGATLRVCERPESIGELADRLLTGAEDRDDPDPERVGDRLEHIGDVLGPAGVGAKWLHDWT